MPDIAQLKLPPDCLTVFLDDTGDEYLKDPCQPFFGLAGFAVIASQLDAVVREPWGAVRRALGGAHQKPIHAAGLYPTTEEFAVIATYFRTQPIARFGAVCTASTDLETDLGPVRVVAEVLKRRMLNILQWQPFKSVEIIFEHSQRLEKKIETAFCGFELQENGNTIPVGFSWMQKCYGEPALEVADFLANAVGKEARYRLKGKSGHERSFEAFFHHPDRRLVSFMEVTRVS